MSKLMQGVLQALIVALLVALMSKAWGTYEQVIELRHDVDTLYSEVSDLAAR